MKKILFILLLVATGYFLSGYSTFSEKRVSAFLSEFEDNINKGNTREACDKLSDSIEFSINDSTTNPAKVISGRKAELCEYFKEIALVYKTAPIADRHYKSNLSIHRNLRNWNAAYISYIEHHEIEFFPERNKINTKSDEQLTIKKKGDDFLVTKWTVDSTIE